MSSSWRPLSSRHHLVIAASLALLGCKFDEPAPSREVYLAAVGDAPPRPENALHRFVRAPSSPLTGAPQPDPSCAAAPQPGTHEEVVRAATAQLCIDVDPGEGPAMPRVLEAAARLVASAPPRAIAPNTGMRVQLTPSGPSRVCVAALGGPPLTSRPVRRAWSRGSYETLVSTRAPVGQEVWALLPCDPTELGAARLLGALEHPLNWE